jgi:hypothetical protein
MGLNTHEEDSLQIRGVTTCATLNMERYASDWAQLPDGFSDDAYKSYSFGEQPASSLPNVTFCHESIRFTTAFAELPGIVSPI